MTGAKFTFEYSEVRFDPQDSAIKYHWKVYARNGPDDNPLDILETLAEAFFAAGFIEANKGKLTWNRYGKLHASLREMRSNNPLSCPSCRRILSVEAHEEGCSLGSWRWR